MSVSIGVIDGANRLFWHALRRALDQDPELRVTRARSRRCIDRLLRRVQPQVLVLEMASSSSEFEYAHYLDRYPGLAILGIDPDSADMIVRMRNLDLRRLVALILSVSGDPVTEDGTEEHQRLRQITPRDVAYLFPEQGEQEPDEGIESPSAQSMGTRLPSCSREFTDVLRWLDLCLHQRLASEAEMEGRVSAPAWAMTTSRARGLLGDEFSGRTEHELGDARQSLEQRIFEGESTSRFITAYEAFGLTPAERRILLMALAPDFDSSYARVFGFLNDDLTRRRPTPALLAQLVLEDGNTAWDMRKCLGEDTTLGRYGLLTVDPNDPPPSSEAAVVPAPELVTFLLADPGFIPHYAPFVSVSAAVRSIQTCGESTVEVRATLGAWRDVARTAPDDATTIQLVGDASTRQWFERGVLEAGDALVGLDLTALDGYEPGSLRAGCLAAARVAVLHGAILLVTGRDALPPNRRDYFDRTLMEALRRRVPRLAVHGGHPWKPPAGRSIQLLEAPRGMSARVNVWQDRSRALGVTLSENDARALAATVRFGEPEIDAVLQSCGEGEPDRGQLLAAVRRVARSDAPNSVRVVDAAFGWDDIVLPDALHRGLKEIPDHVHHADKVLNEWGYRTRMPYGDGVAALFSGPSGTGKTMAAHIIANELGVSLFQVDLAKTVSKYIGETEERLDVVFTAAERASAVLLFDEADALFGKRTEVRDAHDRYANIEVSYLLQRMESFSGLAILTTNRRQNLDRAFLRRLRFDCEFPAPGLREREAIWRRVFPAHAPLGKDIGFEFLARRLKLTGGHIQQIAIRAAFLAAASGNSIEMQHIVHAAGEELRKLGMANVEKCLAALAA